MLLCGRLRRWHGASFPRSVGSPVLLGLLGFSDWQLVQVQVEACHLVSSHAAHRHRQLVPVLGKMLCPFQWRLLITQWPYCRWYQCFIFMVLGSIPAFLDASVAFFGCMVSSLNSRMMVSRECEGFIIVVFTETVFVGDNLSEFTTQCGIDTARVTKLEDGSATLSKRFIGAKQRYNILIASERNCTF